MPVITERVAEVMQDGKAIATATATFLEEPAVGGFPREAT